MCCSCVSYRACSVHTDRSFGMEDERRCRVTEGVEDSRGGALVLIQARDDLEANGAGGGVAGWRGGGEMLLQDLVVNRV